MFQLVIGSNVYLSENEKRKQIFTHLLYFMALLHSLPLDRRITVAMGR